MRLIVAAAFLAAAGGARAETCAREGFEPCPACQALSKDAGQKPGPPTFDYSPILRAARERGEVWTKDRLDLFLSDPEALYAGTWMGSPPIRDAKQRADLLCVLGGQ